MGTTDKQTEYLYAHLRDLREDADKGMLRASGFYTPGELVLVRRWIASAGCPRVLVYGGYEYAERARVYFLPEYMEYSQGESIAAQLADYGYDDPTVVLCIRASGFRSLSHRDFMGSVLSLGIERSTVGDIVCVSGDCAYLFCDRAISGYICDNLKKVANDAVIVQVSCVPEGRFGERQYTEIRDTVASLRMDAIVASACNISREAAKKTVTSGLCELNWETVDTPDAEVSAGDVFSIRGKGKYTLYRIDGENARGRLRIVIHKYT